MFQIINEKKEGIVNDQIKEAFSMLPNKEELKKRYIDSLGVKMNTLFSKEKREILVGVGSINNLNWEEIETLNSYNNIDDTLFTHKIGCDKCRNNISCDEYVRITDENIEITFTVFTDGEFVKLFDKKLVDVKNETLTVKLNIESGTYQVIKSPKIEKHGLASLCYLGQADVDREGKYICYILPEKYLYH